MPPYQHKMGQLQRVLNLDRHLEILVLPMVAQWLIMWTLKSAVSFGPGSASHQKQGLKQVTSSPCLSPCFWKMDIETAHTSQGCEMLKRELMQKA